MAFTKIAAAGIGTTETVTVDGLTVINNGSFGGNLSVGGTLTYEDVTNVDSVGLITARSGINVGSGITLSKDGDGFYTGIVTATTFVGAVTGTASGNPTLANGSNDRIVTATGANALNGESNLQFDGTDLYVSDNIKHLGDPDTLIQFATDTITLDTAGSERLRIDSNGRLLTGHDAALTKFHGPYGTNKRNPHIQINGTTVNNSSLSLTSWDNNVVGYYGAGIFLARSGSSTIGTNARLDNINSILGSIIFSGDDGDEFVKGAMIQGAVDASTGNNDMPGRLMFLTTADGAQEPTERLRITSSGQVFIGNSVTSSYDMVLLRNTDGNVVSQIVNTKWSIQIFVMT